MSQGLVSHSTCITSAVVYFKCIHNSPISLFIFLDFYIRSLRPLVCNKKRLQFLEISLDINSGSGMLHLEVLDFFYML